jgi:ribose transport system substrate-binding protein
MLQNTVRAAAVGAAMMLMAGTALAAGPKIVSGPGSDTQCFKPWSQQTKYFQWAPHQGPFRIAVVNGYVGNTWRIQMIKTARAYAELPEIKADLKEFKVVSVGTDAAAQLGAIEDFINQGYDAIIVEAVSPTGFDRVIRQADAKGVVLVPFDNALDTDRVMQVNEDNYAMGVMAANWLLKYVGNKGSLLEVRGVPGNSVDRDRHDGFRKTIDAGGKFDITEVVGMWASGDSQKVTADALAVHGHFDGVFTQGGSDGTVQAMMDAHQPFVPVAGEGENGFRVQIAQHAAEGLKGMSYGQSPALVAISIKAAIAALKGQVMPQLISVPIPVADFTDLKPGDNYFPELHEQFFADNAFPPCGVSFTAPQIMSQSVPTQ